MSFRKCAGRRAALTDQERQAARVAAALWRAFPEARSEDELARMAAPWFRRADGRPVDPRTVRYWLRGETLPSHLHTLALIMMVGAGFFALPQGPGDGRS